MTSEGSFSLAFITTTIVLLFLLHLKEFQVLFSFFVFLQTEKLFKEINI